MLPEVRIFAYLFKLVFDMRFYLGMKLSYLLPVMVIIILII